MVTGDSVLTAAHVAAEVGILGDAPQRVEVASNKLSKEFSSKKLKKRLKRGAPLLLTVSAATGKLQWVPVWDDANDSNISSTTSSAAVDNTAVSADAADSAAASKSSTTSSTNGKRSSKNSSSKTTSSSSSSSSSSAASSKLRRPFKAAEIERLSRRHDLCVTGDALEAALQCAPELVRAQLHAVRIFARMTPALKETVATAIKVRAAAVVLL
jgi:magnesium-transporting ATPase (P-type)